MIGKNMKVGAAVFGLALGGGLLAGSVLGSPGSTSAASPALAVAATTADSSSTATATAAAVPAAPANPETPLTGDVATQVTAAAQAAVPGGTIDRVETDNDGVYEAHVTKADGTHVIVQVGADYAVTGTIDQPQGGPGGPGGHGGPGAGETALTGDTAASVTAAAQAAIPDGTIIRVETDSDGSPYEAHVIKADGTQVVVKVDANFAVTATQDMPAGGPNGGHHQGPPPAAAPTAGQAATTAG
jgi:uncharacterized membrane protein YkoI